MQRLDKNLDLTTTIVSLITIGGLCLLFAAAPDQSNKVLTEIRGILEDRFGLYYLMIGLGTALLSLYIAWSPMGNIVLGDQNEKPKYSFFVWGSMMFTAGLAADILFYSLGEWVYYWVDPHTAEMGELMDWASTYTLFHWGPIPWGFYLVLAVAFGFMMHVRKVTRQKYSEACRPILGSRTDGWIGKAIDLLAVFALLAGTATTFSVATPLLSRAICELTGISINDKTITLAILAVTCVIYTISVMHGMAGVSRLASFCTWLFYGLLAYVLLFGGETRFILETGFSAIGRLAQNFIVLSTYTDPLRKTGFASSWTIFYWAYWMVWCVAAPFFIGSISKGRTIRQTILGGYVFGLGSTFISFIILGNYGLGLEVTGRYSLVGLYEATGDMYAVGIAVLKTLPAAPLVILVLIAAMIAFYATSFDSITLVAAEYSCKEIGPGQEPGKRLKAFWAVLLILFPAALVFSDSSMANLQSVSIIAAFPVGFVILLITAAFLKDARAFIAEQGMQEK